jgi:hypothetical protein
MSKWVALLYFFLDSAESHVFCCSGMGPDFRVLVRKSRKQAEQYHRLYKVPIFKIFFIVLLQVCSSAFLLMSLISDKVAKFSWLIL